jgi:drug/metabolite transporter (DMT)-like permease
MSGTTLWFGVLSPPSTRRRTLSPKTWTCVGALAIPLWATWPALAIRTLEIPPFESLTVMFFFGSFVFASLHRSVDREPSSSGRSWLPAVVYGFALAGGDACFILATHRIPPAQANLISYLWPVMIVVFGAGVGLFRLRPRQIVGLALGFSGAVILIWDGRVSMSLGGIGLALLSGAVWAAYCIFRLMWKQPAAQVLARGCVISTGLCAILHFALERTVVPGLGALAATAVAGMVPLALGNFVWDEGFRRGDGQLLAVMAYATPLCSALLLAALGAALITWNLLTGAVVIVLAGWLSRADPEPG